MPQRSFRAGVLLAERHGWDPTWVFGSAPLVVHPDALAWYQERLALYRLQEHFAELSG